LAVEPDPDGEELREAMFGTYRKAVMPPAALVLIGLALPIAATCFGLAVCSARTLAAKARG